MQPNFLAKGIYKIGKLYLRPLLTNFLKQFVNLYMRYTID